MQNLLYKVEGVKISDVPNHNNMSSLSNCIRQVVISRLLSGPDSLLDKHTEREVPTGSPLVIGFLYVSVICVMSDGVSLLPLPLHPSLPIGV